MVVTSSFDFRITRQGSNLSGTRGQAGRECVGVGTPVGGRLPQAGYTLTGKITKKDASQKICNEILDVLID